jgi:hypothetical protein
LSKANAERSNNKYIIKFLNTLPAKYIETLNEPSLTEDQKKALQAIKWNIYLITQAWNAKRFMADDPIKPLQEDGRITAAKYRWVWAYVDMQWLLWELVQVSTPDLKRFCKKNKITYPFDLSVELFCTIVDSQIKPVFLRNFKPYYEFSTPKLGKFCKLVLKLQTEIPEKEKQKIIKSIQGLDVNRDLWGDPEKAFKNNPWFFLLTLACKQSKDKTIQNKYERFNQSYEPIYKSQATILRKTPSHSLIRGEKKLGKKAGGTYAV